MAEDTNTPEAGAGQEAQQQLPPLFNATLAKLSADREEALAVLEMLYLVKINCFSYFHSF